MSDLSVWWVGLESAQKFEVEKIILEKGILAFLLALAAFWFTLRQESSKAFQVRRLELEKVTMPRVFDLMNKADALWRRGREAIAALDTDFQTKWSPWLDRVIANRSTPIGASLPGSGAQILESRLKNGLTFREHLIAQTEDDELKQRLSSVVLSKDDSVFLNNLYEFYRFPTSPLYQEPRPMLLQPFYQDFYRDLTRPQRVAFAQKVHDFLIEAHNVIPAHKTKPLKGVMEGGGGMKCAVLEYPEPSGDGMTNGYFAIVSQLREAVAP